MSLTNIYHLRHVADTSAKACFICYKPSTSVLITPDNKDFFYVCPAHLQDRHFCSPIVDTEAEAKRQKDEAMAREIEKVKKEYEEKQRKKSGKGDEKGKEKEKKGGADESKDKEKEKETKDSESETKDEKERDAKIESIRKDGESKPDNSPRVFALHKNFYQMRIDRLRNIEMAKRNQERLKNPSLLPSVPSGDL